jgi:DNA-binding beta-propeller fold protein YncE
MTVLYVTPALGADQIFWTNESGISSTPISYANLDGSGGGGQLSVTGAASGGNASAMVLDAATNKVYWANHTSGTISYANLDGSGGGGELNITGASTGTNTIYPTGIAIDPAAGRVFWSNSGANTISYANLDGSGGGNLGIAGANPDNVNGVAVDPANNKIYWANSNNDTISYANLDGSGAGGQLIITPAPTPVAPSAVAVDAASNQIFWTNDNGTISYASLNGGEGGQLNTAGTTNDPPAGLAIDPVAGKVYWADPDGTTDTTSIYYANLSGSGGGVLDTTGATPQEPSFPVLLKVPSGAGVPVVSGGTTVDSTLSCAAGTWAPDLLGSFLYQAPRTFSYSWTLNGAAISGATSTTITAAAAGQYVCVETAENAAGSTSQSSVATSVASLPVTTTTTTTTTTTPTPPKLPRTRITKAVISSKHRDAKFSFRAIGSATGFRCALVKPHHRPAFSSCRSPKSYRDLKPASYTFEVRALNAAGNGPAATKRFKIT